jgi:hypothetical protein
MSSKRLCALVAAFAAAITTALVLTAIAVGNHSVTDRISAGQINGNGAFDAAYAGTSTDGTRVFFTTAEPLVSTDTDAAIDLYERSNGTTTLVSAGQVNGNGDFDVVYVGASQDGKTVFFTTNEALVSGDTDSGCQDEGDPSTRPCRDVYQRANGSTTLLSSGANGSFDADFGGATPDGSKVYIETADKLLAADTDSNVDVYERSGASTTLVSTGPTGGNGAFDAGFDAVSADGARVVFSTDENLAAADTDSNCFDAESTTARPCHDVYQRSGGTTTLLSNGGNGSFDATWTGASADATKVIFSTNESMAAADTDASFDLYQASGGSVTFISAGAINGNSAFDVGFNGISSDGSRVFFGTYEKLVATDTDGSLDIYQRSGGTTSIVSKGTINGNGAFDVFYRGMSTDGLHVFFTSAEPLVAADTDTNQDAYDGSGGAAATLVSAGQINGNGNYMVTFRGASDDGSRVFFTTRERLVSADADPAPGNCFTSTCSVDVYERYQGTTYLVSFGPDTGNRNANYGGTSSSGERVFYQSPKQQIAGDTDSAQDIYQASVASVSAGYARPRGATPFRVALVPAFRACTTPNNTHGDPLAYGSCSPPTQVSTQLTIGSPDANNTPANFQSSLRFIVVPGNSATPQDDADVKLVNTINDVRKTSDLSDYTGEVQEVVSIRLTDRLNGSAPVDPATMQDYTFRLTIPCVATAATNIGSNCNSNTTADAVLPGLAPENARSMWQMDQVQVLDGGPDGLASTTPNDVFAVPGVFAP